jgi:hypothetical protein
VPTVHSPTFTCARAPFVLQVATAILEELQGWALREGELGPSRSPNQGASQWL